MNRAEYDERQALKKARLWAKVACGQYVLYGPPRRQGQQGRLVNVRPSEIHGLGLFAESQITKGTVIGLYDGRVTWDVEATYSLIETGENGVEWAIEGEGPLRFMNHQENPTCGTDTMLVYARRTIRPGEEMTIYYGKDW